MTHSTEYNEYLERGNALGPIPQPNVAPSNSSLQQGVIDRSYPSDSKFLGESSSNFQSISESVGASNSLLPDTVQPHHMMDHLQHPESQDPSTFDRLLDDTDHALARMQDAPMDRQKMGSSTPLQRKATSRANMLARGGACVFCKKRKLKCTAELPSCAACRRAGKECVYAQKKQRSKVRVLEDRLVELEKRLDLQNGETSSSAPSPTRRQSTESGQDQMGERGGNHHERFTDIRVTTPGTGFTFTGLEGLEFNFNPPPLEPDLMTLADAAAAGGGGASSFTYPWEGLSEVAIASEIVKAVEGTAGVGQKILGHL